MSRGFPDDFQVVPHHLCDFFEIPQFNLSQTKKTHVLSPTAWKILEKRFAGEKGLLKFADGSSPKKHRPSGRAPELSTSYLGAMWRRGSKKNTKIVELGPGRKKKKTFVQKNQLLNSNPVKTVELNLIHK